MSTLRIRLLVGALLLVALLAGAWWFHQEFEFHRVERRNARTQDMVTRPMLVLQRLLERHGATVKAQAMLVDLPPAGATLYLMQDRSSLSHQQSQALTDWVRAGGTLVVTPVPDTPLRRQPDALLDPLNARVKDREAADASDTDQRHCMAALPDGSGDLELPPWYWRSLREDAGHPPLWRLNDCTGLRMLAWPLGRGRLIATEDSEQFNNFRILTHDMAPFAVWLFAPRPGGVIWLIGNAGLPTLPALLARWAPLAVTGFVLLVAGLLWRTGVLSGPRRTLAEGGRRSLAEHLRASAALLWRADRGTGLHAQLRQATLQRLQRRHPGWHALAGPEVARRAGALAGLPEGLLAEALHDQPPNDPEGFARRFRILETLRKNA